MSYGFFFMVFVLWVMVFVFMGYGFCFRVYVRGSGFRPHGPPPIHAHLLCQKRPCTVSKET